MNLHSTGAKKRPTLSPIYGGRPQARTNRAEPRPAELSVMDLRNLVTAMVD